MTSRQLKRKIILAFKMRYGDKCEEKDVKMKNVNPGVMNLINNANFLLNVGA